MDSCEQAVRTVAYLCRQTIKCFTQWNTCVVKKHSKDETTYIKPAMTAQDTSFRQYPVLVVDDEGVRAVGGITLEMKIYRWQVGGTN